MTPEFAPKLTEAEFNALSETEKTAIHRKMVFWNYLEYLDDDMHELPEMFNGIDGDSDRYFRLYTFLTAVGRLNHAEATEFLRDWNAGYEFNPRWSEPEKQRLNLKRMLWSNIMLWAGWMDLGPVYFGGINGDTDKYFKVFTFLTAVCRMDHAEATEFLREKGWMIDKVPVLE